MPDALAIASHAVLHPTAKALLDALEEAAFLVDAEGYVLAANTAACALCGADGPTALVGVAVERLQPQGAILDGSPQMSVDAVTAFTQHQDAGTCCYVRTISTVTEAHGRVTAFLHRFVELSHKRRSVCRARSLCGDARLMRSILDSLPDPIFAKDADLRFIFANQATCDFMQADHAALLGRTDLDFYPRELAESYMADERRVVESGVAQVFDQACRRSGRDAGYLTAFKTPVCDGNGAVLGLIGHSRDVTDLRRMQQALRRHADELAEAQNVARLVSWRWEQGAETISCSRNVLRFLDDDPNQKLVRIRTFLRRLDRAGRHELFAAFRCLLEHGQSQAVTVVMRHDRGDDLHCRITFRLEHTEAGLSLFGVCQDVSEAHAIEQRLHELAYRDGLTGLYNREAFGALLEDAVKRQRDDGKRAALILFDLDRFKFVNDTLGHAAGDRLLILVAERLRAVLRDVDPVVRLGGDEFAVLVTTARRRRGIDQLAERLLAELRRPFELDDATASIGASIGIALLPEHAADAESWLINADIALYQAKEEGRDCARVFEPSFAKSRRLRINLSTELREAIAAGSLGLVYQPQVRLTDRRVLGFEALSRWHHPIRGPIAPSEFVALAEQSSLIADLGRYTLVAACRQWRRLADLGHPEIKISVNVSPAQLWHMDLPAEVALVLADVGMPADALVLEVTEGVFLDHHRPMVTDVLETLAERGVKLALDDFGTGFSNLAYLSRLPFSHLKIDRSFVAAADAGERQGSLLRGLVSLGNSLRLEVVAEGIETEAQHTLLGALGCPTAQGYLYGRPMRAADAAALLTSVPPRAT